MIYHILTSNIYTERFIQFMKTRRLDWVGKHQFIFVNSSKNKKNDEVDCIYKDNFWDLLRLFLFSKKTDRFILHAYMHPYLYLICFLAFWNQKKVSWIIWGGDLYFYDIAKKTLKYRIYEFFRKRTIKKFGYIAGIKGDYDLAMKYYQIQGKYFYVNYPQITPYGEIIKTENNYVCVLIGNSGDPSNEHLTILKMLEQYKEENIRLFVPLSYGATEAYKNEVIEYGKKIYGDKFMPITIYMPYSQYMEFLHMIDVMVCFHNRQQAIGNILQLLELGRKVFIRRGITTADYLDEFRISYSFTDSIPNMDFAEFCNLDVEEQENNHMVLKELYSEESLYKIWNIFYDGLLNV